MRRRRSSTRVAGEPTSSNGASSLHLWWELAPSAPPLVSVSVTLEVLVPPPVPRLVFWALQASSSRGGMHLGLQAHPRHPGGRAVNFGGYARGGGELAGSPPANTRPFPWSVGRPYRLTIRRGGDGWEGLVDDVVVRTLFAAGSTLTSPVVWTEAFCRCDDPSVSARWSGLSGVGADGSVVVPRALRVGYQSVAAGGCSNTTARPDGLGVMQETNTERVVPDGAWLTPGS